VGRNPRTRESISIPASKNVRFKAGKDLRDLLNAPKRKAR
jgi:DNA-binding protein HU-beta